MTWAPSAAFSTPEVGYELTIATAPLFVGVPLGTLHVLRTAVVALDAEGVGKVGLFNPIGPGLCLYGVPLKDEVFLCTTNPTFL